MSRIIHLNNVFFSTLTEKSYFICIQFGLAWCRMFVTLKKNYGYANMLNETIFLFMKIATLLVTLLVRYTDIIKIFYDTELFFINQTQGTFNVRFHMKLNVKCSFRFLIYFTKISRYVRLSRNYSGYKHNLAYSAQSK